MDVGPASGRSNPWSAKNTASLVTPDQGFNLQLEIEIRIVTVAGTVTLRLLHIPTPTRGETATNVVAVNVNVNVLGGKIANEVGSLLVVVVVAAAAATATGSGLLGIPTTATIVVLETANNVSIYASSFRSSFVLRFDLPRNVCSSPQLHFVH